MFILAGMLGFIMASEKKEFWKKKNYERPALSYSAGLQIHFPKCVDSMVIFLIVIKVTFKGDKWPNK